MCPAAPASHARPSDVRKSKVHQSRTAGAKKGELGWRAAVQLAANNQSGGLFRPSASLGVSGSCVCICTWSCVCAQWGLTAIRISLHALGGFLAHGVLPVTEQCQSPPTARWPHQPPQPSKDTQGFFVGKQTAHKHVSHTPHTLTQTPPPRDRRKHSQERHHSHAQTTHPSP